MRGLTMEWHDLCFLHWRVPAEQLRQRLPAGLELDLFEGEAWLGLVPFVMQNVRPLGIPNPFGYFPEFNVRTYVRDQQHSGVWFFSLDAADLLAVRAARLGFGLPYFHASMDRVWRDQWCYYATRRRGGGLEFRGRYRPAGEAAPASPGSLEEFLCERYWLFSCWRGQVHRARVHHTPYQLQAAEAEIFTCDVAPDGPPASVLFSRVQKVRGELLEAACLFR